MECRFILFSGKFRSFNIVTVGFVNGNGIGKFENTLLNTLQFVSGTGNHQHQKEIDHRCHSGLGLTHTHGFNDDNIKPGSFTHNHGLPGFAGNAAQRASGRRGANKRPFLYGQLFHTGLICQYAAATSFAAGINSKDCHTMSHFYKHCAEAFDKSAFTHTRHPCYTQAYRLSCKRKQSVDNRLCQPLMGRQRTFNHRNGFGDHSPVTVQNTLHIKLRIFGYHQPCSRTFRTLLAESATTVPGPNTPLAPA